MKGAIRLLTFGGRTRRTGSTRWGVHAKVCRPRGAARKGSRRGIEMSKKKIRTRVKY